MKTLLSIVPLALCCSCSITQEVVPIPADVVVDTLYIRNNAAVHMQGFLPELQRQIEDNGVTVHVYDDTAPDEAQFTLEYIANWKWDMAMYLSFFHADVFEQGRLLASMEYDARSGGANMGKFGDTAGKIRPLVYELFGNVLPPATDLEE